MKTIYMMMLFLIPFSFAQSSPPVISSITADPFSTSAYISWNTDILANATVVYGIAASNLTSSMQSGGFVFSRIVNISSLNTSTRYFYQITSCSVYGLCAQSSALNFTTTPRCADGTLNNTCSLAKPKMCNSALALVDSCPICGCTPGYKCVGDVCRGMPNYYKLVFSGILAKNDPGKTPCSGCSITLTLLGASNTTNTLTNGSFSLNLFTTATPGIYPAKIVLNDGTTTRTIYKPAVVK